MALKVLLIDDDQIFHKIIERCCGKIAQVEELVSAFDGAEGLALIEGLVRENGRVPDVVFVDVNMPVLDGFGFLRGFAELRQKYASLSGVRPIAMLTSSDQERDRELALELGADQFLVKGTRVSELTESIVSCLA